MPEPIRLPRVQFGRISLPGIHGKIKTSGRRALYGDADMLPEGVDESKRTTTAFSVVNRSSNSSWGARQSGSKSLSPLVNTKVAQQLRFGANSLESDCLR